MTSIALGPFIQQYIYAYLLRSPTDMIFICHNCDASDLINDVLQNITQMPRQLWSSEDLKHQFDPFDLRLRSSSKHIMFVTIVVSPAHKQQQTETMTMLSEMFLSYEHLIINFFQYAHLLIVPDVPPEKTATEFEMYHVLVRSYFPPDTALLAVVYDSQSHVRQVSRDFRQWQSVVEFLM